MAKIGRETLRTMLYSKGLPLSKRDLYNIGRSLGAPVTRGMRWDELFDSVYDGADYLKLIQTLLVEARSRLRTCPDASKHILTNFIHSLAGKEVLNEVEKEIEHLWKRDPRT